VSVADVTGGTSEKCDMHIINIAVLQWMRRVMVPALLTMVFLLLPVTTGWRHPSGRTSRVSNCPWRTRFVWTTLSGGNGTCSV